MTPDVPPRSLILLDVETTGLPMAKSARVVEVAAIVIEDSGIVDHGFRAMVRPDVFDAVEAASALLVNGLTVEDFRDAPDPTEIDLAFRAWWQRFPYPLYAWRGAFDRQMLVKSRMTFGETVRDIKPAVTVRAPGSGKKKLGHIAHDLGIAIPDDMHRAFADAVLAARVWCAVRDHGHGSNVLVHNVLEMEKKYGGST
jgi:DNA polymerase III epsilon subunit-like protein